MDEFNEKDFECGACRDTGEVETPSQTGDGWFYPAGRDLCDCRITDNDIPF
jgi:hypothetical protein